MGTQPKPNPIPNPNHTPKPNPKRTKKTNPSPNPNNPKPKPKLHDPQKCLGLLINLVQIKSLCAKYLDGCLGELRAILRYAQIALHF